MVLVPVVLVLAGVTRTRSFAPGPSVNPAAGPTPTSPRCSRPRRGGTPVASGPIAVTGTTWVSYTDDTREPICIATLDGVRLLITGSGSDGEFRTLAAAATGGEVLPR